MFADVCPELNGKETLEIHDSIPSLNGSGQTISSFRNTTDFLVVGTLNTQCSMCSLVLKNWEELIEKIVDPTVPVILISTGYSKGGIQNTFNKAAYDHPVLVDLHEAFNKANGFSNGMICNSFLIDRNGRLLLAGNIEARGWIAAINRKVTALRKMKE